ncbi:MAG: M1 family metallopeptidase, partial [Planctomycetota bacterium]|nr:M1 family metallopeptidase [Planctomycetota bacterium]
MLSLLLLIPLVQGGTNDSGGVLIPEQRVYDVLHYTLDLDVDPDEQTIAGSLTMRARAVEDATRIALDLDGRLVVSEVRSGPDANGVLDFVHENGRIWIDFPGPLAAGEEFVVRVAYGGKPRVAPNPPWEGGFTWARTKAGKPWIATSCQGEGADLWWPCKDHPSDKADTMDIVVTVPKGLICASNGVLMSEEKEKDGRVTFHWRNSAPISNYNVALNIAPYEVIESKFESVGGETVPVYFYALPEHAKKAKKALKEFIDHLRFFEELLGPYPFRAEKYGIAETPHLGMEHQTIIAYGYGFRQDRGYDWLHHHELSHEWWANLVTCADWKDMWIHESFGTYMQALYMEKLHGPEGLRKEIDGQRRGINNRRPVAPRETHSSKQIYFAPDGSHDNDIYNKGSLVLHTLRWTIEDEAFFESLR